MKTRSEWGAVREPVTETGLPGRHWNGATVGPTCKVTPTCPALSTYLSNQGVSCVLADLCINVRPPRWAGILGS